MPWLVSGSAGQYSLQTWWPVAVFATMEEAEDFARRAHDENQAWLDWRCPNADTTCSGRTVTKWNPGGWWRREHCACGGGPPVTLDTRCGAYERREASYEVDEVKGKGVP